MVGAMHGAGIPDGQPTSLRRDDPSKPAMFFWTTFGIAFETLCRPAAVDTVSAGDIQSIALDALAGLLRREVAGSVISEEGIFEDVCDLLFRLSLTEGPAVKVRVLEIAVSLAPTVLAGDSTMNPRLKQCLQIATTVIRELLPATSSSASRGGSRGVSPRASWSSRAHSCQCSFGHHVARSRRARPASVHAVRRFGRPLAVSVAARSLRHRIPSLLW